MRRASTIALLSLLASAATASAECAWVLWGDQYQYERVRALDQVQWKRYRVYPSYAACWAEITELTVNAVRPPGSWSDAVQHWFGSGQYRRDAIAHRIGDTVVIAHDGRASHWVCLPDTVDPRVAKGK